MKKPDVIPDGYIWCETRTSGIVTAANEFFWSIVAIIVFGGVLAMFILLRPHILGGVEVLMFLAVAIPGGLLVVALIVGAIVSVITVLVWLLRIFFYGDYSMPEWDWTQIRDGRQGSTEQEFQLAESLAKWESEKQ